MTRLLRRWWWWWRWRRHRETSHQHTLTFRLAELPCVDCVLTEDGTGHPSRSFHTPGLTSSSSSLSSCCCCCCLCLQGLIGLGLGRRYFSFEIGAFERNQMAASTSSSVGGREEEGRRKEKKARRGRNEIVKREKTQNE